MCDVAERACLGTLVPFPGWYPSPCTLIPPLLSSHKFTLFCVIADRRYQSNPTHDRSYQLPPPPRHAGPNANGTQDERTTIIY